MHAWAILQVPHHRIDDVSLLIWSRPGVLGIEELPLGGGALFPVDPDLAVVEYGSETARRFAAWIDAESYRKSPEIRLKVHLEIADRPALEAWVEQFRFDHPALPVLDQGLFAESDYLAAYRGHYRGRAIGHRLWVGPPWEKPPAHRAAVTIEPGAAFGTGDHPSTVLCLESLDRLAGGAVPIQRIFDVGTGSGVLAIAAARLWPDAELWLCDLDPGCASNCQGNFARNGLADHPRREFWGADAELEKTAAPAAGFDLILSNIYTGALESLVDPVARLVRLEGWWMVSGLLQGEEEAAFRSRADARFACRHLTTHPWPSARQDPTGAAAVAADVWVALELVRRSG